MFNLKQVRLPDFSCNIAETMFCFIYPRKIMAPPVFRRLTVARFCG